MKRGEVKLEALLAGALVMLGVSCLVVILFPLQMADHPPPDTSPDIAISGTVISDPVNSVVEQTLVRIKAEEGRFRLKPYRDIFGVLTIGYGINLEQGITPREAEALSRIRLEDNEHRIASEWAPYAEQPTWTQVALLDMDYQLGDHGVLSFHDMLGALKAGDCPAAKAAALDSDWAGQTEGRAKEVTAILCED